MRERASRSSGSNAHRTPRDAFRFIDGRTATAGACACAPRIAALTGAGFSAESGVPTFRDARIGLWAQFDPWELAAPATFARNSLFGVHLALTLAPSSPAGGSGDTYPISSGSEPTPRNATTRGNPDKAARPRTAWRRGTTPQRTDQRAAGRRSASP